MSSVNVQRIGAVNAFCDATKRLRGWVETQTEGDAVSLHAPAELTEYVFTKTADFSYCDRDLINGPEPRALVALGFNVTLQVTLAPGGETARYIVLFRPQA